VSYAPGSAYTAEIEFMTEVSALLPLLLLLLSALHGIKRLQQAHMPTCCLLRCCLGWLAVRLAFMAALPLVLLVCFKSLPDRLRLFVLPMAGAGGVGSAGGRPVARPAG
jgi:hypothetical protein